MSDQEEEDDGFVAFEEDAGDRGKGGDSDSGSESSEEGAGGAEEGGEEEGGEEEGPAPATVLYVGHLPYGFFEKEMLKYFTQFGKVVNVRVARSSRTAKSKGYGWVQFKSPDVAAIACKTMHGYMLFRKKLDCKILTPQQVTAGKLFRNSRRRMLPSRRPAIHKAEVNEEVTKRRRDKMVKRNVVKRGRLQKELEQLGIEYELPPVEAPRKSAQGSKPRVLKKHKKAKATE